MTKPNLFKSIKNTTNPAAAINQLSALAFRIFVDDLDAIERAAVNDDPAIKTTVEAARIARERAVGFEAEYDGDAGSLEELYDAAFDAVWIFCKVLNNRARAAGFRSNADALLMGIETRLIDRDAETDYI